MRGRAGRAAPWVALGALCLLVAVVAGAPPSDGPPLDPRSTGPAGARGLVEVLEELGAEVEVSDEVPAGGEARLLVLADRLDDDQRDAVLDRVDAGAVLVVADPASALHPSLPPAGGPLADEVVQPGTCDLPAVAGVGPVATGGSLLYAVPPGAASCHGDGETAFVVASPQGQGVVVALGGAAALTNDLLDEEANAELAAALLAPAEGSRVVLLEPRRVGGGDEGLVALLPVRVEQALAQLAVAFLLYALLRARRLGRPVAEPQPVPVAGSELVAASGRLRERAGHREATAERLRAEAVRALTERLGVPPSTPPEQVADLVAARSPALAGQADAVRALLVAPPPADDPALVDLAARLEALRRAAGR